MGIVPIFNSLAQTGYGDAIQGFPSLTERQLVVLTNACRMAPVQYREAYVGGYAVLDSAKYPPVAPLYWNLQLNRSARDHALDMGDTCGALQHNSCNGTSWDARIKSFYSVSSWIGENIAYSTMDPFAVLNQWLLDIQPNKLPAGDLTWVKDPATGDSSRADGHRWNIMFRTYGEFGTGYAYGLRTNSKLHNFWVQDFGGGKSAYANPVVAGSHFFKVPGKITFFAGFYDFSGKPPQDASMTLSGQKMAMTLLMGSSSRGTYQLVLVRETACRAYHFSFVDGNGKTWRYPEHGGLVTSGEGSCTQEYVPDESLFAGTQFIPGNGNSAFVKSRIGRYALTIAGNDGRYVPERSAVIDCSGKTLLLLKWNGAFPGPSTSAGCVLSRNVPLKHPPSPGLYFIVHRFSMGNSVVEKVAVPDKQK